MACMKLLKIIIFFTYFCLFVLPVFSAKKQKDLVFEVSYENETENNVPIVPFESIPDSSNVRRSVAKTWLLASPEELLKLEPTVYYDDNGKGFKFMAVLLKERNEVAIVVTPLNTDFTSTVDYVPQGTWILYKDYNTGENRSLKIYPRENPELYLRLTPAREDMTYVDICLFNAFVKRRYPIGLSFNTLCYFSISQLRSFTKDNLNWDLFNPPNFSSTVEACSDIIAERLSTLVYLEDGGFDEWGVPIHLKDGRKQTNQEIIYGLREVETAENVVGGVNSHGFLKWIIDGMVRPIAGQGIFVQSLMTQTEKNKSHFNTTFDNTEIFLGLDWIRNLSAAALTLQLKRPSPPLTSGVDVKIEPFASAPIMTIKEEKVRYESFEGCLSSAGYQTAYLQALLYYLAVTEPGHFYLGAVNREVGSSPLRQYNHVVSFFPYFDALGAFHIDVYESAKKTNISRFVSMNQDAFVALTRVKAPERGLFNP
ncbi:MAG: hypothetical protein ACTTJ3_07425 [Treponema sp.]